MATHDNADYVNVDGVDLHPGWGVLRAIYPTPGKWHLGTYECEDSICGRGPRNQWYGFEECEPLSSVDPADLCRSCVRYVRAHNVQMAGGG